VQRIPVGALQEREFRLFFTGQTVSLLGDAVTPFALAWAMLDLTGSAPGPRLRDRGEDRPARRVPAGGWRLRRPTARRGIMPTADVVRLAAQGATAALLLSGEGRLWELVLLQAVAGIRHGVLQPRLDRPHPDDGQRPNRSGRPSPASPQPRSG
jgi:hypothetical protein